MTAGEWDAFRAQMRAEGEARRVREAEEDRRHRVVLVSYAAAGVVYVVLFHVLMFTMVHTTSAWMVGYLIGMVGAEVLDKVVRAIHAKWVYNSDDV